MLLPLLACLVALASCETFEIFKGNDNFKSHTSDGSAACKVFTRFQTDWTYDFANIGNNFADEVELIHSYSTNTPDINAYKEVKKMTRDEFVEYCSLIGSSYRWFRVDYDCFGHGNKGAADMYTTTFNEYLGTEGVMNAKYLFRFETNDKGQMTKYAVYEYEKKPLPLDTETSYNLWDDNAECDISNEEVFMKSPGKVSLEKCQSLCTNEPKCHSITHFQSGYCSLFSTYCNNRKFKSKAISQYKLAVPKNLADLGRVVPNRVFEQVGSNSECDGGADTFLNSSPGADTTFDQCKQSCKDNQGCQSLTYFLQSGYCSHFNTACDKVQTRTSKKITVISLRLVAPPQLFPWSKTTTAKLRRA